MTRQNQVIESHILRIVFYQELIVFDKLRVLRNPETESVVFFSVIDEADSTEAAKKEATPGEPPGKLANFKAIPERDFTKKIYSNTSSREHCESQLGLGHPTKVKRLCWKDKGWIYCFRMCRRLLDIVVQLARGVRPREGSGNKCKSLYHHCKAPEYKLACQRWFFYKVIVFSFTTTPERSEGPT